MVKHGVRNCYLYGLPVRCGVIKGGVGSCLEVNDSRPPALTSLLLVIISREGSQEWGAAGSGGQTLVLQGGRRPSLTYPGDRRGGCAHLNFKNTKTGHM